MEQKNDPSQNALKHGCRSNTLFVPGETKQDYDKLSQTWLGRYHPTDAAELRLVTKVINADWKVQRSERVFDLYETDLLSKCPNPADWSDQQMHRLTLLQRYKTADANAFNKALRNIEHLKKSDQQTTALHHRQSEQFLKEAGRPLELIEKRGGIFDFLRKRLELPTNRNDGGCTCTLCLWEWGIENRPRRKKEEPEPPPADQPNPS